MTRFDTRPKSLLWVKGDARRGLTVQPIDIAHECFFDPDKAEQHHGYPDQEAPMNISRRTFLADAARVSTVLFAPKIACAESKVLRMGSLRAILTITPHFYDRFAIPGYTTEIITFETPTDGKNAVVTQSVDFGMFGSAAAILGAAAGEPLTVIASSGNRGMAVIARKDQLIASIKDLKDHKVAILPGSTQEIFLMVRLRMEGLSIKDITPVRVPFGEMHAALARGDVDAYIGAEPAPGLSIATGEGKLVEYPYSTPMGTLNTVTCTHEKTLADNPDLVSAFLKMHRRATEFAESHQDEKIEMSVKKLGARREGLDFAMSNIELTWRMDALMIQRVKTYADHMLEFKQIRTLPNYATFLSPKINDEIANG
jgi:ABC-type nitrate/sulfonate/bicarbonate transport system substrate-binding protein